MFAGKKSAQIREILISESAWEEMTCLFAPSFTPTASCVWRNITLPPMTLSMLTNMPGPAFSISTKRLIVMRITCLCVTYARG
ncbi:TPA: hypothetical protein MH628_24380 [Klebsiella pneumoniae]|nr:hypothetical protein [Klebsiella pneumoniae]